MTIFITENYYLKLKVYRYIKRQMMYHENNDTSSVFLFIYDRFILLVRINLFQQFLYCCFQLSILTLNNSFRRVQNVYIRFKLCIF